MGREYSVLEYLCFLLSEITKGNLLRLCARRFLVVIGVLLINKGRNTVFPLVKH